MITFKFKFLQSFLLQDRGPNRLTQFIGVLLRPKGFDEALSHNLPEITNGHNWHKLLKLLRTFLQ